MKIAVQLRLRATPLLFLSGAVAVVGGCSRLAGDPQAKIRELDEKNQYRGLLEMLRALQVTFPTGGSGREYTDVHAAEVRELVRRV